MNICLFYLVIFGCSLLILKSYGRKLHYGNSFVDYEFKSSNDDSKLKKMRESIYPKVKNFQTKSKHLFKINTEVPQRGRSNVVYDEKGIHSSQTTDLDHKTGKVVSTEIGKHLVKITSVQSETLDQKLGPELQLSPKFSHTIEIIPIDENENVNENSETAEQIGSNTDEATKSQNNLGSDVVSVERDDAEDLIITSKLESNDLELKLKAGGYEISAVPKYKHTIEISSEKKNGVKNKYKSNEYAKTENVDSDELLKKEHIFDTNELDNSEEFDTNDESANGENEFDDDESTNENEFDEDELANGKNEFEDESSNGENEFDDDESDIAENAADDDELVNGENALDTDESVNSENSFDASESINTENELDTNEIVTSEHVFDDYELSNAENDFELNGNQHSFDAELEGSGEDSFRSEVDDSKVSEKSGRFVFSRNGSAPNCTTPKGEAGQCKRIRQCLLSDALSNFNVFLQHLCLIRGALVGVCCPNNPVIEISNDEDVTGNATESEILQPPEGCGLNTKTRIVGGTISVPHEWTWMVALLRRDRFYCGGVIINNLYVLTAAHCVMGINVKELSVRLGEYDFNTHNKHQEDISVAEIKRHAQFVTLTFQHDIALLKLKRSIQYSKFVGSICLPSQKARDYSDVNGTVVGWGTVSFGGAASPILRQVTIPIWKNEDCDRAYLMENINESFMCAGSPEKGEDACQGDSGGPLMSLNDQGRWDVIGIVSWGRRCGDPSYPGVYTRVTTYLDWIAQNAV